jgi:hypothetical protein
MICLLWTVRPLLSRYKTDKTNELTHAGGEIASLYKYVAAITTILQNMEDGYESCRSACVL